GFLLAQKLLSFLFNPLALGNVAADCEPAVLTTQFERLCGIQNPPNFSRFTLHRKFKVAHKSLFFQNCQDARAHGWLDDAQLNRGITDDLVAIVAAQRYEAVITLENDAIFDTADYESIGAGPKRFRESLLAFSQRFVGALTLGDVEIRNDSQYHIPLRVPYR